MTVIVVDPASIKKYGALAVEQFTKISQRLQNIVGAVITVHYFGTNAYEFKTKSGDMAVEYATALHKDLKQISDAVRTATSQIAKSLGGQPITLPASSGSGVKRPAVAKGDGTEEANTEALEQLIPEVKKYFTAIDNLLDAHLKHLSDTKWEGNAKTAAVQAVRKFTNEAKATSNKAEQAITKYIRAQVDAVTSADKTLG
ncbi:MAG TPA: hypothetical protein DCR14_15235 [Acidimicrobiaceae bacterium]|nr:hypothetical protein [Acidimicrobiaceae bacterium]